jgi:hypothetical protein
MSVTANITVSFGAEGAAADGSHLSAAIDDRPDGLNGGDTSFMPGDVAYFLVYQSDNVTHDDPIPSAGAVAASGSVSVTRVEDITFANEDTATLSVPASGVSVKWFGNALGKLTLQPDKMTVKADAKGVAVGRVTYTASAKAYGLTSPLEIGGETDFSILVFILGHEIPVV